jgi:DHA1 family bicyclomycin/chloramphenicol resistance-like MFS transporter
MLLLAATGTGGMWGVLVPLFLALSTYGFMGANSSAAALSVDPRRAGSITGLTGVASFTIGALATASVGFVHDGTAVPMAASMAAAFAVSTAALFLLALRGREPLR